jgi:hypothetical protein
MYRSIATIVRAPHLESTSFNQNVVYGILLYGFDTNWYLRRRSYRAGNMTIAYMYTCMPDTACVDLPGYEYSTYYFKFSTKI